MSIFNKAGGGGLIWKKSGITFTNCTDQETKYAEDKDGNFYFQIWISFYSDGSVTPYVKFPVTVIPRNNQIYAPSWMGWSLSAIKAGQTSNSSYSENYVHYYMATNYQYFIVNWTGQGTGTYYVCAYGVIPAEARTDL